jgi:hypothetical protein
MGVYGVYGYVWMCMALYGCLWVYGIVWLSMDVYRCMDAYGRRWMFMGVRICNVYIYIYIYHSSQSPGPQFQVPPILKPKEKCEMRVLKTTLHWAEQHIEHFVDQRRTGGR